MKRHHVLAAVALLATTALAPAAFADEVVASTSVSTAYYTDQSFDAISDVDAMSNLVLMGGYQFDALGGLRLLGLFQTSTRRSANRFAGDLSAEWGRQRALVLAEYGIDIGRFVRPFARAGLGYAHQVYELYGAGGAPLKDHAHDLTAQGSLGLNLRFPISFGAIGLQSDVGYEWQTPATFDELHHSKDAFDSKYAPEDDPWTREDASVGTLKTQGIFWTAGLFVELEF